MSDNLKIAAAITALIGIGFVWYMYLGPALDAEEPVVAETLIEPAKLRYYRQLNAAAFDPAFFKNRLFQGLQSPPSQGTSTIPAGRPNPFVPF